MCEIFGISVRLADRAPFIIDFSFLPSMRSGWQAACRMIWLSVALIALAGCGNEDPSIALLRELYGRFDPTHPGFGVTDYGSQEPNHIPKSYAMILLGELARHDKQLLPSFPNLAPVAGNWLLDNAQLNASGQTGWGVPLAWDAYGDGSTNPANTVYTISTAIAINALLDWRDKIAEAPHDKIIETVKSAVEPFLDPSIRSPSGLLPYSLAEADQHFDTFNPAVYMAGQMQRLSHLVGKLMAERLRDTADETMKALLKNRLISDQGHWYWNYSIQEDISNDLAHAIYIIEGIRTYMIYGGRYSGEFDWAAVIGHVRDFVSKDEPFVKAWPIFERKADRPARSYDLGIGLHVVCKESGFADLRPRFLNTISKYRNKSGQFTKYPPESGLPAFSVNEYESYLYLGIATCAPTVEKTGEMVEEATSSDGAGKTPGNASVVPFARPLGTPAGTFVLFDPEDMITVAQTDTGRMSPMTARVPLARLEVAQGLWTVERSIPEGRLSVSFTTLAGRKEKNNVIGRREDLVPIFRGTGLLGDDLVLVYYDNAACANYAAIYELQSGHLNLKAPPYQIPSVQDPAGGTYEMVPKVFVLTSLDTLHIVAGRMHTWRTPNGQWRERQLVSCEKAIEAVMTDKGPAVLCLTPPAENGEFILIGPGDAPLKLVDSDRGIPWKLRYVQGELLMDRAATPEELGNLIRFDLERADQAGWMEFGVNNTEGRIAWSQLYYLNGFLDILYLSRESSDGKRIFASIVPDIRRRLDLEISLLDRFWRDGWYRTRAFTVDRSPANFAVQTSRLLLLFHRYLTEVENPVSISSYFDLRDAVRGLRDHMEVLIPAGYGARWLASGRAHLRWPRGCAFSFDGLNVPFNHQNEWSHAILETENVEKSSGDAPTTAALDILNYFLEQVSDEGRLPSDGVWNYWWGKAFDGWSASENISANRPSYPGDHIKAWISFRSIDALAALAGATYLPDPIRKRLTASASSLTARGLLYPFVLFGLQRLHQPTELDAHVARRYARASSPWEFANSPWALVHLPHTDTRSAGAVSYPCNAGGHDMQ